ncbi:MAG: TfoX/Sxy family protein [Bacteroidales bacterium]|nr:TfoX/Sxy family protein [Bacteroidales bacterium]
MIKNRATTASVLNSVKNGKIKNNGLTLFLGAVAKNQQHRHRERSAAIYWLAMDQISGVGIVTSKKMFGEYMVYVNQKPVILICNNTAYVKKLDCIKTFCENGDVDVPYKGAKEHYVLDVDDKDALIEIIREVEKVATVPKKKVKK